MNIWVKSVVCKCHRNSHSRLRCHTVAYHINSSLPGQNVHHFADDIFKCIFLNENIWISIKISLKFVPNVSINNIPALVQIMAWRRPGAKPLSEPMLTQFTNAYIQHSGGDELIWYMKGWIKWLTFCRQHFKIHFVEINFSYCGLNFTAVYFYHQLIVFLAKYDCILIVFFLIIQNGKWRPMKDHANSRLKMSCSDLPW